MLQQYLITYVVTGNDHLQQQPKWHERLELRHIHECEIHLTSYQKLSSGADVFHFVRTLSCSGHNKTVPPTDSQRL